MLIRTRVDLGRGLWHVKQVHEVAIARHRTSGAVVHAMWLLARAKLRGRELARGFATASMLKFLPKVRSEPDAMFWRGMLRETDVARIHTRRRAEWGRSIAAGRDQRLRGRS